MPSLISRGRGESPSLHSCSAWPRVVGLLTAAAPTPQLILHVKTELVPSLLCPNRNQCLHRTLNSIWLGPQDGQHHCLEPYATRAFPRPQHVAASRPVKVRSGTCVWWGGLPSVPPWPSLPCTSRLPPPILHWMGKYTRNVSLNASLYPLQSV